MRRAHRSWLPVAVAMLAALIVLPTFASDTNAANTTWVANCSVRLRTLPKTTATTKAIIPTGVPVTASSVVSGSSYSADCPGRVSGTKWLKIISVNGKSTSSLYGVSAVYAASGLFKQRITTISVNYLTNCSVRLRTTAWTSAGTKAILPENAAVTSSGKVTAGWWKADCRTNVSGNTWYKITAVNGKSVSSLYGVSALYAASGLFRAGTATRFLEGIDVSHWQGWIDWAKVRGAGKRFAFAKATEGVGVKDSRYAQNKSGAMANGIAFGAYHFAQPVNDPIREADWFVNNTGYKHGMLVPVLDLERTGGRSTVGLQNWVKAWLGRVQSRLGVKAAIYTSPGFWRANMGDTRWFADNGYTTLWVAHWDSTNPSVPGSNWGGRSWTFWQYTDNGRVPGISTYVDLNFYHFSTLAGVTY
jgi:lysozyme